MTILETTRLSLRELRQDDFMALCAILQDRDVMYAYEHAFDASEVQDWLDRQCARYRAHGFGLWAVILKESGQLIGQCGLSLQALPTRDVLEVGYLFRKDMWHKGYASEAAIACKQYAFERLGVEEVFSLIRDNNYASQAVARRNGMYLCGSFVKHYYGMDMPHLVFSDIRSGLGKQIDKPPN